MKLLQRSAIIAASAIVLSLPAPLVCSAAPTTIYSNINQLSKKTTVSNTNQYRGIITSIYEEEGVYTFTLSQAEGTNFGSPHRIFETTNDTDFQLEKNLLKEGAYIEVSYRPSNNTILQTEKAISISPLVDAAFSIYNGTVSSITKKNKNSGEILLTSEDKTDTLFRYAKDTKFEIDIASIKKGDKLTIYYNGITTRSIPAQAFASEIRKMSEAQIYRGTVTNIRNKNENTILTLARAKGSDFSEDTLRIVLDNTTKSTIDKKEIEKDMYLEVYYEPISSESKVKNPTAISVENLLEADMVNYGAIISSIETDEKDENKGTITVTDLDGTTETLFHYSAATDFKVPIEDLEEGKKVNIYHRGIFTLSIPAQGSALEITEYKE